MTDSVCTVPLLDFYAQSAWVQVITTDLLATGVHVYLRR